MMREPFETTRNSYSKLKAYIAGVQFLIDSCRVVSRSNYLKHSNEDCDWLILACLSENSARLTPPLLVWRIKVWFENSAEWVGKLSDSLS